MNLIANCVSCVKSSYSTLKTHFEAHGKTYLLGVGMLVASTCVAYLIHANLQKETHRLGGGRHMNIEEFPNESIRTIDVRPVLTRLSLLIKGGAQTKAPSLIEF